MDGWIKLHRKITEHWVWNNPNYLKAWLTIIITVNHENKKVLIQKELIDCERGQSILSLKSWAEIFGKEWSIQRVRTFFDLLKCDSMITIEGLHKTTRLTVCNYDSYQDSQQTDNTQVTSKEHASNKQVTTNKNDKNDKNEKKEEIKEKLSYESKKKNPEEMKKERDAAIAATLSRRDLFYSSLTPFLEKYDKQMLREFFDYWSELTKSQTQMRFEKQPTWEVSKRLATWASKEKFDGNRKLQRTGVGNSAADKAASRKSLEEQANAILGINQPKNSPGGF